VANLARRTHGSESESRSTDHGHPIAITATAGGPSPLRLLEWRISDVHRRISTYIPATLRPWNHPIRSRFSLQIGYFGAIAQLAERLDRTGSEQARRLSTIPLRELGLGRWNLVRPGFSVTTAKRRGLAPLVPLRGTTCKVRSIYGFRRSRRRGTLEKSALMPTPRDNRRYMDGWATEIDDLDETRCNAPHFVHKGRPLQPRFNPAGRSVVCSQRFRRRRARPHLGQVGPQGRIAPGSLLRGPGNIAPHRRRERAAKVRVRQNGAAAVAIRPPVFRARSERGGQTTSTSWQHPSPRIAVKDRKPSDRPGTQTS
jgi:hypothetical protein